MDKKRRETKSLSTYPNNEFNKTALRHVLQLVENNSSCGMTHKKFTLLNNYGTGFFESFSIDGITIHLSQISLIKNIKIKWRYTKSVFELSYLLNGEKLIELDTVKRPIIYESLDSYFVNLKDSSGTVTYLKNKSYSECKIHMHTSFIEKYNIQESDFKIVAKNNFYNSHFKPHCKYTQHILTEVISDNQKGFFKRLFLESKVLELLRLYLSKTAIEKTDIITNSSNYIKKLYQVQSIISSDLSQQHTIGELARRTGLNDFILKKEFKTTFGKTVFEYVTHLRMKKAKKLLKHTQKPIYEIAELVGYKNATHFSAAFKRFSEMSPKLYRNLKVNYL